jgi:hypothetical protein
MVHSVINDGKFVIWADAPNEEALFETVCSVLDGEADDVFISATLLEGASNHDFKFKFEFEVYTDGLFVGGYVANILEKELEKFESETEPVVSYKKADD